MNWLKLLASVAACQLAGILGAVFTSPAIPSWYAGLEKAGVHPARMAVRPHVDQPLPADGVAAYLVWQKGLSHPGVRAALAVFVAQLLLNALWSPMFFGLRAPLAGAVVILLLWLAIVLTIFLFWKISRPAAAAAAPLSPLGQPGHGAEYFHCLSEPMTVRSARSVKAREP